MSKYLYLMGGKQNEGTDSYEKKRCNTALLLRVNLDTQNIENLHSYVTPIEYKAEEDASVVFKAGYIEGDRIYLCTTTEVFIYQLPDMKLLHYITHPYFNDVHHVCPGKNNSVIVASTGLDAVFEVSYESEVINEWGVLGKSIWDRFDKNTDYRKILSTKPHESHPNYVFYLDNDLYVNRLMQRDAICLTNPTKKSFFYELESGHDGLVHDNKVYFTTVNGYIQIFDAKSKERIESIDLNKIFNEDLALGWCRGIEVLDDDNIIIGFSRLRPTKWKENIGWVKHRLSLSNTKPVLPTRIACVNVKDSKISWTINLENNHLGEIFSVIMSKI